MTRKNIFLITFLVILIGGYAIYLSGLFAKENIQIMHNIHGPRQRSGNTPNTAVVTFGFTHPYELTDVKVVSVKEWETNSSPVPLWHLISDSNSIPLKMMIYGQWIRGMKPAVAGVRTRPLLPGETYLLTVKAGARRFGQHEFHVPAEK